MVMVENEGEDQRMTPFAAPLNSSVDPSICEGRLSGNSTDPPLNWPDSSPSSLSTIYFYVYKGNRIALYNGSTWDITTLTTLILFNLSGVATGKNYDIFIYNNSGSPTIELGAAWTDDTTRSTSLDVQDGVLVKATDHTRRYVGTLRGSGTNATLDNPSQRFLWNYYNRLQRKLHVEDTTDSWTYASTTWRQSNANTANKVEIVNGISEDAVSLFAQTISSTGGALGIGSNSITAISSAASVFSGTTEPMFVCYMESPRIGYSYYSLMERTEGGSVTFNGDAGNPTQYGVMTNLNGLFFC
jgi:hypothetical protein